MEKTSEAKITSYGTATHDMYDLRTLNEETYLFVSTS